MGSLGICQLSELLLDLYAKAQLIQHFRIELHPV